ncbi:hypothetical protein FQA39_LY04255 [Lamprigera yunnana]|nr:hypothetical protein FQA39_LY04255 [Lamprigera yunnana]
MAAVYSTKSPASVVQITRASFQTGKTQSIEFREKQLRALLRFYEENTSAIVDILGQDLHKNKQEVITLELELIIYDVKHTLDNLGDWVKPERPSKTFPNWLDNVYVYNEPYGVVLIIGAWNYPFLLTLSPLTGAIAAGNCVVIKPSEISCASAKFMYEMLPKYLDSEFYQVFCGGPEQTSELLQQRFDYIFFTGSTQIGKLVHAAANKYLTPTTLELGGKSPVYIDNTANIDVVAHRVLWGKWINAGQTCIAPDYILCSKEVEEKFLKAATRILHEWYKGDSKESRDFCRIINDKNYQRLLGMLKNMNGKIALGGKTEPKERFMELTVVVDIKHNDPVMSEEIFGPILPIMTVNNAYEAINYINQGEKPLALYVFSKNKKDVDLFLKNTSSGGTCINDTIMQFCVPGLPFGGVGASGMGAYHGKFTFDTFTHKKGCLYKDLHALGEKLASGRYPPYSAAKIGILKMLLKYRSRIAFTYLPHIIMFALGLIAAFVYNYFSTK